MNKKYILNGIKKANKLTISVFNFLYKLDNKKFNKIVYKLTSINEMLTNLEIQMEIEMEKNENERL